MRSRRAPVRHRKAAAAGPEIPRRFSTALRAEPLRQLERLGRADVLVGIPCFNNDATIEHVIASAARGLAWHYPGMRCAVVVADGGSTDDTREVAGRGWVRVPSEDLDPRIGREVARHEPAHQPRPENRDPSHAGFSARFAQSSSDSFASAAHRPPG